ncbi:diguanylate cyclase domain-containing protein [Actinoplanes sp. NPDC049265]|uniref:diguanylate cyclase domain-containing protein n=1 Tax=Actinoplanes sp. NPDC049265 TaxID=3363902 RepID=UPI0037126518
MYAPDKIDEPRLRWYARERGGAWRIAALIVYGTGVFAVLFELIGRFTPGVGTPRGGAVVMMSCLALFTVATVVFTIVAGFNRALDQRTRAAWRLIALSSVLSLAATVARGIWPPGTVFPAPGDVFGLAAGPVLLAGLLWFPLRSQSRRDRRRAHIDAALVAVAAGMTLWYLYVGPSLGSNATVNLLAIAYPAIDLMRVFGATLVLQRGAAASVRRSMVLICCALLAYIIADVDLGYQQVRHGTVQPSHWQYALWLTAGALLTAAPVEQCLRARTHRLTMDQHRDHAVSLLPYLGIVAAYVPLLLATRRLPLAPFGGLVVGALAVTALVVARQISALRENSELVATDPLTGLVNRRRLYQALDLNLARSVRSGSGVAMLLIDLDGFKEVNDTLGHEAGDRLLIAFGSLLRRNVLGSDTVARQGGDEFAVVLPNVDSPDQVAAVVRRIVADMRNPLLLGDVPVCARASIGIALSDRNGTDADELLRRADAAMYQAKRRKGTEGATYEFYAEATASN